MIFVLLFHSKKLCLLKIYLSCLSIFIILNVYKYIFKILFLNILKKIKINLVFQVIIVKCLIKWMLVILEIDII
jgi:hypothetical protein